MTDKGKMLIMMMGKKPHESSDEEQEDEEGSYSEEGLKASMEDFLKAVKDENTDQMAECFKYAFDLCEKGEHEEGPDDYEG